MNFGFKVPVQLVQTSGEGLALIQTIDTIEINRNFEVEKK